MGRKGSSEREIRSPADDVFATITDLGRLPAWNGRMTRVVSVPPTLEAGAEWVVELRVGRTFESRSVVLEYDAADRRFVHRSKPDDDNPSSTVWTWTVDPSPGGGSRVTLHWDMQPQTAMRRLLVAPVRAWQIPRRDAPDSLAALAALCEARMGAG